MAEAIAPGYPTSPPPGYPTAPPPAAPEAPRGEGDKAAPMPTTPESIQGGIFGAGQPKELDTVQSIGNMALPHLATTPAIMAGGTALPAAPWAGRAIASGFLGAGRAASKGEDPKWGFLIDSLLGLGTEGAAKGLPYLAKIPGIPSVGAMAGKVASEKTAEAGFKPAMKEAAEAVRKQLPTRPFLHVPAVDKWNPLTLDEAVAGVNKLKGTQFEIGRAQLINSLNGFEEGLARIGARVPGSPKPSAPFAGSQFGMGAPTKHVPYTPTRGEKASSGIVGALNAPTLRSFAESVARSDIGGGGEAPTVQAGLLPADYIYNVLSNIAGRIVPRGEPGGYNR